MGLELESEDIQRKTKMFYLSWDPSSSGGDGYIPIKSYRNKYDLENINGRWSFSSFSALFFAARKENLTLLNAV